MTLTYPGNLTHAHMVTPEGVAAALQRLYEDPAHRETLADAAYRNATRAEFNWKSIAARWRQLFDDILAE
jgi:glycosyltransferase involved in cell wall biosynthesis